MAPCTELGEPEESKLIREGKSSGYSSGQSLCAIEESVWAYVERSEYFTLSEIEVSVNSRKGNESFFRGLRDPEIQLDEFSILSGISVRNKMVGHNYRGLPQLVVQNL